LNLQKAITIIIADDHQLFADGMTQILHAEGNYYKVIGIAKNGKELLHQLNAQVPDVILMDINMPILNGLDTAAAVRKRYPAIKVILLSMQIDSSIIQKARELQLHGALPKFISAQTLKESIYEIVYNEKTVYIGDDVQAPVFYNRLNFSDFSREYRLSVREMDIVKLIHEGKSTKEMAALLFLSTLTIETHRKNIFKKLQITSMGQLLHLTNRFILNQ
jgi:DNA-binding NarL/FixJ family response regulator